MLYHVPVLARLCGYGSILCLKYLKSSAGAVLKGTARHLRAFAGTPVITSHNNEGTSLTGKRLVPRLSAAPSQA